MKLRISASFLLLWISALCLIWNQAHSQAGAMPTMDWIAKVGAKSFLSGKTIFSANKYGAINGYSKLPPKGIQAAIHDYKDVYVSDFSAASARKAISADRIRESTIINFNFSNLNINAGPKGTITYASGWTFDKPAC